MDNELMRAIGEMTGEIRGIQRQIEAGHDATNRRIEDLKKSVDDNVRSLTERVSANEKRISVLEDRHTSLLVKTTTWGSVAGAMAAAFVQLIKLKT